MTGARALTPGMRRLYFGAAVLVFLAGLPLYVLSARTDRYFAWTIAPPLTAAFFGAGYWASVIAEFLASRERTWARARVVGPGVFVFTALTLVATIVHRDRFHFHDPDALAKFVAWSWLVVYAVVPPVMAVLLLRQLRVPGADPPRERPVPPWFVGALAAEATAMFAVGFLLFGFGAKHAGLLWPWTLTPLTARATGAWLIGLSVVAAQAAFEADFKRVRPAAASSSAFALLQFVALARYPDTLRHHPSAVAYIVVLAGLGAAGVYALVRSR